MIALKVILCLKKLIILINEAETVCLILSMDIKLLFPVN
uniref:Uncharacterized protein n=1 Tax=uncultured Desulfobacterium sp. TaxID=201089 RepID=E1Y974_9BACT|nr:unknown protein [uncultured Desulfobacterium sp.]